MSIPQFTLGYPPDGSSLGNTKSTIRNNLDGTFEVFGVDHVNQNLSNPGYHTSIHFNNLGADPSTTASAIQLYSKTSVNPGTPQLFFKDTTGGIAQLTGGSAANPGYTYMNGFLMQFGFVAATINSTGTVTFPIPFSSSVFSIQTTLYSGGSFPSINSGMGNVAIKPSLTNFPWQVTTNSSGYIGFYWMAIGV